MKKYGWLGLGLLLMLVNGCISMNIAGSGVLDGTNLGATVDPIHGRVGVEADKTLRVGDTETSVGASSSGEDVNVNTHTRIK